jgi:GT2 family glycosyltransferase
MPVRNEAALIAASIDAVLNGTVAPNEIIVVDGQSTDGTREIVQQYAQRDRRVALVDNPQRTIPSALNHGWNQAAGDLIVRVDGHAIVSDNYVERVRDHLASGQWQGVGGRKVPESGTTTGKVVAAASGSRWGVGNSRYHYAEAPEEAEHVPFGAYPRAVIASLGGWDEALLVNQDFEFDHRLRGTGGRILFDPSISSRWACSSSLRDLSHQYRRYGSGKARVGYKHPDSLRLRHVAPALLPITLVLATASLVSGLVTDLLAPSLVGGFVLAMYVSAMALTAVVGKARELPLSQRIRFPIVVGTMHLSFGIGMVRGLVAGATRRNRAERRDPYRARSLSLDAAD